MVNRYDTHPSKSVAIRFTAASATLLLFDLVVGPHIPSPIRVFVVFGTPCITAGLGGLINPRFVTCHIYQREFTSEVQSRLL